MNLPIVTNGAVLRLVLDRLLSCNGGTEFDTVSKRELFNWVHNFLTDGWSLYLGDFDPLEVLRGSVEHLIDVLEVAGLIVRWTGEPRHSKRDPERFCLAADADGRVTEAYFTLQLFRDLVAAETEGPEVQREVGVFQDGIRLLSGAVNSDGVELADIEYHADSTLELLAPDQPFMPRERCDLATACWQLIKAALLARDGQVKESVDHLLRAQTTFLEACALGWMRLAGIFVQQSSPQLYGEIVERKGRGDIAATQFVDEIARQQRFDSEVYQLSRRMSPHGVEIELFLDPMWLNDPFVSWEDPQWRPQRLGIGDALRELTPIG